MSSQQNQHMQDSTLLDVSQISFCRFSLNRSYVTPPVYIKSLNSDTFLSCTKLDTKHPELGQVKEVNTFCTQSLARDSSLVLSPVGQSCRLLTHPTTLSVFLFGFLTYYSDIIAVGVKYWCAWIAAQMGTFRGVLTHQRTGQSHVIWCPGKENELLFYSVKLFQTSLDSI